MRLSESAKKDLKDTLDQKIGPNVLTDTEIEEIGAFLLTIVTTSLKRRVRENTSVRKTTNQILVVGAPSENAPCVL